MKSITPNRWQSTLFIFTLALLLPLRTFAAEHEDDSPLHGEMEGMNKNLRQLGHQYKDPAQKDSSLALVASMQKHAETARTMTPPKVAKLTGDAQTALLDTFHKDLDGLIKEIATLKDAIASGNNDAAKAEIDKIRGLKESGHHDLGVGKGGEHHGPPPSGQ
jgi:soluble cytochrome b562